MVDLAKKVEAIPPFYWNKVMKRSYLTEKIDALALSFHASILLRSVSLIYQKQIFLTLLSS
jgi:hypothetical protein